MFEKLKRAKTFIAWGKSEEPKELDLSEYSHLRRNIPINNAVLERQKSLVETRRKLNKIEEVKRPSSVQMPKAQEELHEKVLDQLRRINFGGRKVQGSEHKNFNRGNPMYYSERPKKVNHDSVPVHRNTVLHSPKLGDKKPKYEKNDMLKPKLNEKFLDEVLAELQNFGELTKETDVKPTNFDRKNFAYISERTKNIHDKYHLKTEANDKKDESKVFVRNSPKYSSERISKISSPGLYRKPFNDDLRNPNYNSESKKSSTCSSGKSLISSKFDNKTGVLRTDKNTIGDAKVLRTEKTTFQKPDDANLVRNSSVYLSQKREKPQNALVISELKEKIFHDTQNNVPRSSPFNRSSPGYSSERNYYSKQQNSPVFDRFKQLQRDET